VLQTRLFTAQNIYQKKKKNAGMCRYECFDEQHTALLQCHFARTKTTATI